MREPTDRQMQFASTIAETLGIELPAEKTRQSLFLFIRDNKPKYDARQRASCGDWTECLDREEDCNMAEAMSIDLMTGCIDD